MPTNVKQKKLLLMNGKKIEGINFMDVRYEIHPAASEFPMMDEKRYSELVEDIQKNGLLQPITLCDGMILDGRNRYKACQELGIEPETKTYEGNPWAYVWSLNGQRRDLVAEQRYLIWLHCSEMSKEWQEDKKRREKEANEKRSEKARQQHEVSNPRSGEKKPVLVRGHSDHAPNRQSKQPDRKAKAAASNVNPSTVKRGDTLANNRPDLAEKVRQGEMKPAEAHREMQRDRQKEKAVELPDGKYLVIYADPPWKYNDAQAVKGDYGTGTGAAAAHYPTMSMSELRALPVEELAANDSVLFLWSTSPLIEDALSLAKSWGFQYKAMFIWDKVGHNMGHYNSVRHELLLICTRGSCTPQNLRLYDSVQVIEKTKQHSEKPEEFRHIIDDLYPEGRRIELFRRGEAPEGWETWGYEA